MVGAAVNWECDWEHPVKVTHSHGWEVDAAPWLRALLLKAREPFHGLSVLIAGRLASFRMSHPRDQGRETFPFGQNERPG